MLSSDGPTKSIPRHELIALALDLGVDRPEQLSDAELLQHVSRASVGAQAEATPPAAPPAAPARGWFQVARNLVASMLEKGLNLPSAARVLRETVRTVPPQRPPFPTVTLAQIYIAQGHTQRAVATLQQVLRRDPKNPKARRLLSTLPVQSETGSVQLERDVVVIVRKGSKLVLYWELTSATLTRLKEPHSLELRVSLVTPSAQGAHASERVLSVAAQDGSTQNASADEGPVGLVGHSSIECAPDVVVRAALGDDRGHGWRPLCVASLFRVSDSGALIGEFSPLRTRNDQAAAARAVGWLE
jgi:hypothetical protein